MRLAPHRFLTQDRNLIASAVLAATQTRHSAAIRRDHAASSRAGNGRPVLSGPYEGDADTSISVRIVSGGNTPIASVPVFVGVGSGELTGLTVAPTASSQTYTLTLTDTGTATTAAGVELDGYRVEARQAGGDGDNITIDVDEDLTYTASGYSLLRDMAKDANNQTGPEWDWGLPASSPDVVPALAPRVCIGGDRANVYRAWRSYTEGQWVYHLLPAAQKEYPAGSRIYTVTGSRTVTVSDGVTPETYHDIVTLRDLLAALDASNLVRPLEIPSAGQTRDNLAAVVDMRLRTGARLDQTDFINVTVDEDAYTETIEAACFANTAALDASIGRERWTLKGSVSGDLGIIRTGEAYTAPGGRFSLTIPTKLPDGYGDGNTLGKIGTTVTYAEREDGEAEPPICIRSLRLGPGAEAGNYVYKYTKRPIQGDACECKTAPYQRLQNIEFCLGIEIVEENEMGTRTGGYYSRSDAVAKWHRDAVGTNAAIDANGELRAATNDMDLADRGRSIMMTTLQRLYDEGDLSPTAWAASTAIAADSIRQPATANGYRYVATVGGTTASSAPTWPTTIGATVTDGGVTWRCLSKLPTALFDALLTAIDADFLALETINATDWTESIDQIAADTAYVKGDLVTDMLGNVFVCIRGGTTELYFNWITDSTPAPGTVYIGGSSATAFMCLGKLPSLVDANAAGLGITGIANDPSSYSRKWQAWADEVLVAAELDPNFDGASSATQTGRCWRDVGDAYWWQPQGNHSSFMPVFTNHEYVSCYMACDGTGDIVPTHGFSIAIVVADGCIQHLKEGDTVTVNVLTTGWASAYKIGDVLKMTTIAGQPLSLAGGVTGTDTYTWSVRRSVDGPGAAYSQDLEEPDEYDDGDVAFTLTAGGIPGRVGDQWSFAVTAEAWQWREGAGAWSASLDIGEDGSLPDGLAVTWEPGADPAYVADDLAVWSVLQPYAVTSAIAPTDEAMAWDGDGCTITAQITGAVDCIAIARHTLPDGATVNISDGADLDEDLTWRAGPMVLVLDEPLNDPTLTITIDDAPGGAIGWLWAGEGLAIYPEARTQTRTSTWSMLAGEGVNPTGALAGYGMGFSLFWHGFIRAADMAALVAGLGAHKAAGNLPLIFVPSIQRPDEAALVMAPDSIEWGEFREWLYDDGVTDRCISAQMELAPWLTS